MGFIYWMGRVTLWVVFLPLGLWRSIRHGRKQSEKRQAKLFEDALKRQGGSDVH